MSSSGVPLSEIEASVQRQAFPIILAGNCNSSVGVIARLHLPDPDVFWFDAHLDAEIPDETKSVYFDGMGLAMMAGSCWNGHMASLEGYQPVPFRNMTFVGGRAYSQEEHRRVIQGGAHVIAGGHYREKLEKRLGPIPAGRDSLVHVDLECLHTSIGRANDYAKPDCLLANDLKECLSLLASCRPRALTIASFDSDLEDGDAITKFIVEGIAGFMKVREKGN